jgi:hypothetical protein
LHDPDVVLGHRSGRRSGGFEGLLFDFPGREPAQRAKKIDGRLPRSLIELPAAVTGETGDGDLRSLAVRDLERGSGVRLPSGEAVAREFGVEVLTSEELALPDDWAGETPLWFYILKESQARAEGDQLGPVGARIVGEVLVGLIDRDPESFRANAPDWRPTVSDEGFGVTDLLSAPYLPGQRRKRPPDLQSENPGSNRGSGATESPAMAAFCMAEEQHPSPQEGDLQASGRDRVGWADACSRA